MAFCFAHAQVEATGTCDDCKKPICTRCTKGTMEGFMCPPCAQKRYGRRKLIIGLKVAGVAAVMIGLAVFGLVALGGGKPKASGKPDAAVGEQDPYIQSLREQRDQAPCDKELVRKLVKELMQLKRFKDAVDDANAYFAKCDEFPRLKWDVIYSLQQLGRYAEAVKHESDLIARDPYDSDFWWWRGEDRGRTDENELALADYRQSFANADDAGGSRFPAARILDVAGPAGRPCEGVFALDYFVSVHEGELSDDLTQQARGLDQSAQCAAKRGQGELTLASPMNGDVTVKTTIAGVEGTFLVDPHCGTTAVSNAFAQLAQVKAPAGAKAIETMAAGAIRKGPLMTLTLVMGKATAPETEVALVDGLPSGVDGVIGMSVLWKFQREVLEDGGMKLSAP